MILNALALRAQSVPEHDLTPPWRQKFINTRPFRQRQDTVSVVFIGDVMMHARQLEYDYTTFLEPIRERLEDADLAVANMEFTLAGEPYSGYPSFSAPDGFAQYVADCGVDVFLTANNHILDKGRDGAMRTIGVYRGMKDIQFTGIAEDASADTASYPLIVPVRGIRVALVNFTYGTNASVSQPWPKVNRMRLTDIYDAIDRADARGADFIVAVPHWGAEYQLRHSGQQEQLAEAMAARGVDAIVGTHPHVVQDSTMIGDAPVFYSLGNAVSNMSARNTRLELMVTLRLVRESDGSCRMLSPVSEFLWCTLPGTLTDSYATIAVKDYIGKRDLWKNPSDYDNMIETYNRVKVETGIE